jgi:sulfate transport system permease protein
MPPSKTATIRADAGIVGESPILRRLLVAVAAAFLALFLVLPLAVIFAEALRRGVGTYFAIFSDHDFRSALRLTLLAAAVSVPLNLLFGIAAAWAVTKYHFVGKSILTTLIDLPFAVSPVVAGLMFVLLFGRNGWLGPWLSSHEINIIFAVPGIIIATMFVTSPFVARELIPLMQSQGTEEEEAAITLGAGGWRTFWCVTLPNIRWGLLYGVILCSARAIGEFGAVSVVSGHVRGRTNTLPLHIEILYNDYSFVAAFAVASLLAMLALATLGLKSLAEWKQQKDEQQSHAAAGIADEH